MNLLNLVRLRELRERTAGSSAIRVALIDGPVDLGHAALHAGRIRDVFTYTHRQTDVPDRYFVRMDVTEEFPFLASKLAPFFEV
jgi:hypothetical protein